MFDLSGKVALVTGGSWGIGRAIVLVPVRMEATADLTGCRDQAVVQAEPLGRAATPEGIAPAAVFLASEEAAYATGRVLAIDGGLVMH